MLQRIARICYRRRRIVVVGWIALVVALSALSASFAGEWRNDYSLPGSEAQAASRLLEDGGFEGRGSSWSGQIVVAADDVTSPSVRDGVAALVDDVRVGVEGVTLVSPFESPGQVSADGSVAIVWVEFGEVYVTEAQELAASIRAIADGGDRLPAGVQLEYGGEPFWEVAEFSSEAFGLLAAMVILLLAFGSVLAMGLPIASALFGIGCGVALVTLIANVVDIPDFATAAVVMIGIGVGIDYALMIVTRYREELSVGSDPESAVVSSMGTAGRAVFVAGCTVIVAMLGMYVVGFGATRSVALAIIVGVLMVLLASLTLLPALLGFCGRNIDRLRVRRVAIGAVGVQSWWYRWSRFVQRRPLAVGIAGVIVLGALAAPVASMRLGFSDAGNRPTADTARRAHDLISTGFGPGHNGPLFVAVDLPADEAAAERVLVELVDAFAADAGVADVLDPIVNPASGVALVRVTPTTSFQDEATSDLVRRIRDDVAPPVVGNSGATVLVGGAAAAVIDFSDDQSRRLVVFIAAVLAVAFVLLLFVYRSVLVPLKAVVMNLLSIGAAYGVVVAVFQWGWGAGLIGVEPAPVEAWVPMMMFAIVFGLSMDYEVFLLSRIRERYFATGDNSTAVADGLARTARLITAAAAIMVFVFGAFVLSADRALQLIGFGLAVAVLLDATVVRLLLVPATMEMLGDRNWWLPNWLERRLPARPTAPAPSVPSAAIEAIPPIGADSSEREEDRAGERTPV